MLQNRSPEEVWSCFVGCLRLSALPEPLWGSAWEVLGAAWAPFGWFLGRLGQQAGASKGVLKEAPWTPLA